MPSGESAEVAEIVRIFSVAVAAYALALLRHLKTEGAATAGLDAVAEDALVRTALLHDVGKHDLEGARLNDPSPDERERESLRRRGNLSHRNLRRRVTARLRRRGPVH